MGLVFLALLVLGGLISMLVTFTSILERRRKVDNPELAALKHRAAAAAVAIALARKAGSELKEFPLPPTALVSAWQAVMRSNILSKRGHTR